MLSFFQFAEPTCNSGDCKLLLQHALINFCNPFCRDPNVMRNSAVIRSIVYLRHRNSPRTVAINFTFKQHFIQNVLSG